ncbi:hypothetical protein L202_03261 [Cryptococcus amylolentus CBS 6039]|uniref:Uncharacterized protein n=1 Tax=Cryptococcus amylolentus CBS 6039 TaxID=1295533 RepID=A0A1E3HXV8_9TREE|nr:hypothetical protein L202_03261 [Cryptococcus amylolentus CBS 6039]ODN81170.1 hypothetical protein L202_03261 [Cryptococcus amylolentus CBS 6039]
MWTYPCGRDLSTHRSLSPMASSTARLALAGCPPSLPRTFPSSPFKPSSHLHQSTPPTRPPPTDDKPLVPAMAEAKVRYFTTTRTFPPLHQLRNEELSQMLLDSFYSIRLERYHSRRYKFVRKLKAGSTPARYAVHEKERRQDEEDKAEFDDVPKWVRGEEWSWAGLETSVPLKTSEVLRIPLYPSSAAFVPVKRMYWGVWVVQMGRRGVVISLRARSGGSSTPFRGC